MRTPTLRSAVAQKRWDVAAYLLVYGLMVIQMNGHQRRGIKGGPGGIPEPERKPGGRPRGD